VVGRAPSVLGARPRAVAFFALLAVLVAYYESARWLPTPRFWIQVAFIVFPVIPAMFALVWLALPLWPSPYVLPVAIVLGGVAVACELAHFYRVSNFAKFGAYAAIGFWFLRWFEEASWVVLVACIIPFVDAFSVYRGPTGSITKHHFSVYEHMAVAFIAPGRNSGAMFGPPDILFFALFTAAARRFRLRVNVTWILCAASYGAALVVAQTTGTSGIPALPFVSVAFLLANADLLWRRRRERVQGDTGAST
jgi:hypothetical protein